jgi:hypothetical protein
MLERLKEGIAAPKDRGEYEGGPTAQAKVCSCSHLFRLFDIWTAGLEDRQLTRRELPWPETAASRDEEHDRTKLNR